MGEGMDGLGDATAVDGGDEGLQRTATGCEAWSRNDNQIVEPNITGWAEGGQCRLP